MNHLCLGIIPDGNRRFAKQNNMPMIDGYRLGLKKIHELLLWAKEYPISDIVLYGFSTENWQRDGETLDTIFSGILLREEIVPEGSDVRFRIVGEKDRFPAPVAAKLSATEEKTARNTGITLWVLASYGGRADIVQAVNALIEQKNKIDENDFKNALSTFEVPDPDLILRTGNVRRLSNFLPWESVYSELYFIDSLWPDLMEKEFATVMAQYRSTPINRGK